MEFDAKKETRSVTFTTCTSNAFERGDKITISGLANGGEYSHYVPGKGLAFDSMNGEYTITKIAGQHWYDPIVRFLKECYGYMREMRKAERPL
jgi:hypothetical protein